MPLAAEDVAARKGYSDKCMCPTRLLSSIATRLGSGACAPHPIVFVFEPKEVMQGGYTPHALTGRCVIIAGERTRRLGRYVSQASQLAAIGMLRELS
jgi:hypothetical protein